MPIDEIDAPETPWRSRQDVNTPLSWMPLSPFRQPEARWLLAGWILHGGGRFSRSRDGDDVRSILAYRRGLARAASRRPTNRDDQTAALSRAHALYEQDDALAWEIRARLLAGESMQVIADKTGEDVATVIAFESAFFQVTDHLQAHDWLLTQALRVGDWTCREPTEAQVWMCNGLYFGPVAVDVLVAAYHAGDAKPDASRDRFVPLMRLAARGLCTPTGDPDYMQDLLDALPDPAALGPRLPLIRFLIRDGRRHGQAAPPRQEAATPLENALEATRRN